MVLECEDRVGRQDVNNTPLQSFTINCVLYWQVGASTEHFTQMRFAVRPQMCDDEKGCIDVFRHGLKEMRQRRDAAC